MSEESTNVYSVFNHMLSSKEDFEKDIPNQSHKWIAYSLQFGIDKLYGDTLTLIDSLGLPKQQEDAAKSIFRKMFNERYHSMGSNLILLPQALMETITPGRANSLPAYTIHQNKSITGYGEPELPE